MRERKIINDPTKVELASTWRQIVSFRLETNANTNTVVANNGDDDDDDDENSSCGT